MIDIKTYNYTGERNRVDKTALLTATGDYTGVLNASFDILHPVVRFRVDTPVTFNYAQIPVLGNRFYFVDTIKQDGNICIVSFSVDVLHTYRETITNMSATLVHGENGIINAYASNRKNVYDVRPVWERLEFSENKAFEDSGNIVMVTIKGNV